MSSGVSGKWVNRVSSPSDPETRSRAMYIARAATPVNVAVHSDALGGTVGGAAGGGGAGGAGVSGAVGGRIGSGGTGSAGSTRRSGATDRPVRVSSPDKPGHTSPPKSRTLFTSISYMYFNRRFSCTCSFAIGLVVLFTLIESSLPERDS